MVRRRRTAGCPQRHCAGGLCLGYPSAKTYVTPRTLETDEIAGIVDDYRQEAENAKRSGFDGVELHAANGYLFDQFLHDGSNQCTDRYGGSIANRASFWLEAVDAVLTVWPRRSCGDASQSDVGHPQHA